MRPLKLNVAIYLSSFRVAFWKNLIVQQVTSINYYQYNRYLDIMQEHKKQKCCPDGSWPALKADYHPKGKKFPLADTTVYHVGQGNNRVIVIISDIFGATSGRHQNVADTFAEWGYSVYLPEILITPYTGDLNGPMIQNIKSQNWEKMEARFKALHQYLKEKGIKEFFGVGFCWGVWAGFKLASRFDGFKAFVGFHPSFGLCHCFNESETALMESVKCPAFFCPAQNDPPNIKQKGELVEILKKRFGAEKVGTHQFPEQVHGFVVRGDVNKKEVHRDVQLALKLGKEYLAKF